MPVMRSHAEAEAQKGGSQNTGEEDPLHSVSVRQISGRDLHEGTAYVAGGGERSPLREGKTQVTTDDRHK